MARIRSPISIPFIRLTPAENRLLGFTDKARRYIAESDRVLLQSVKDGLSVNISTISARSYEQLKNTIEFGQKITKEQRTERIRKGTALYRSPRAAETVQYQRRARYIRAMIDNISAKDVKLIDEKRRVKWTQLTKKQQNRFKKLFDIYPRVQVLEALGSPVTR